MSDDTPDQTQPPPPAPPAQNRWGDPIPDARKAELAALFERQAQRATQPEAERGDSQFKRVSLTGADVFWLAVLALAATLFGGDTAAAESKLRAARDNLVARAGIDFSTLHLEGADLRSAHLEGANLSGAHLERFDLHEAHLEGAELSGAHLESADLHRSYLQGASLFAAHLERADLSDAHLEGVNLIDAYLERADLSDAHLQEADLSDAHLEGANLYGAHLEGKIGAPEGTDLARIRQWATSFADALEPADLSGAFFDHATILNGAVLVDARQGAVRVADVRWGGVNLAVIPDWTPFTERHVLLGDERAAWEWKSRPFTETAEDRKRPGKERAAARARHHAEQTKERLAAFQAAVRANRQLATALRTQGMNEEADHFAYRAQVVQRAVFRLQGKRGRWAFSGFLDFIAGYGYQPQRSVVTYLVVLALFTGQYMLASYGWLTFGLPPTHVGQLQWYEALVLSVSSFHGRGFFQPLQSPGDPVVILAAMEAICGLIIEISFIATFTQRFFGR